MQEDNVLKNNQVKIQGRVASELSFSHEVYGESFYNLNIDIIRLSEAKDILPVTISERLIDKESLKIGTIVYVTGQIRSYNNYLDTENKNRLILTIFARDIKILQEEDDSLTPNEVIFNGFICKRPVFRTTPFGREICDILIAVNRAYNKSDYIPCISWGRNARFSSRLNVGEVIKVWGRMQSRNYQKKLDNGEVKDRVAYEVSISKIEMSSKEEEDNE